MATVMNSSPRRAFCFSGEAIALVFAKFAEMQSVRQVHLWFRHERVPLPAVTYGAEGRLIEWKLPVYNTILHILTNPIYAGAYAFGPHRQPHQHRGRPQEGGSRL